MPAKTNTKAAESNTATKAVVIPPLNIQRLQLHVVGESPLICHRWSEKARRAMLDKQMKRAQSAREAKDPEQDFWGSLYILQDNEQRDASRMIFGFPSVGFKNALVAGASFIEGITKVQLRGAIHFVGEYVVIGGTPTLREDMVRLGGLTADIRHRGEFKEWSATLDIRFNPSILSAEQIAHLTNLAGFSIGVGEWRPQKDGSFGRFRVATDKDLT
jgi:hypothetical protein